jgi:NADH dehydrogenase FAD-containing subunit
MKEAAAMAQVVVLGAGYTGMMAAIRVARRSRRLDTKVTLVNPSSRFTERLRMHQMATGQQLAHFDIPDMIKATGIEFAQGWATSVDPERRQVVVGDVTLDYDYLIYAIGSRTDTSSVPGADTHAYTLDHPLALAERLAELPAGAAVTVCGNGLTGLEAATEIAESYPHLRVVLLGRDVPAAVMGEKARAYVRRSLERLGVEVRSGVEIIKVLPDAVELAGGELVNSDACVWTTGFSASPLAADSGLAVDSLGRITVDPALRSVTHPSVFAIGDAAAVQQSWGVIHGTCQSGMPTGVFAADTIVRLIKGKEPGRFRFGYIHQPVSLGRRDAVIQFTKPNDTPGRWYLRGKPAVWYKALVTGSPAKTYRLSRRINLPSLSMWRLGGRATR